jgi:hypothetical protein
MSNKRFITELPLWRSINPRPRMHLQALAVIDPDVAMFVKKTAANS